jgi:hypothetical protein
MKEYGRLKTRFAVATCILVCLCIVLNFQACTGTHFSNTLGSPMSGDGRGESYDGKPTVYVHFDSNSPCTDVGANGLALPNHEIFLMKDKTSHLVRKDCMDIAAIAIDSQEISLDPDGSGSFTYQGHHYIPHTSVSDFDVISAQCPASLKLKVSPSRVNLIKSSQYIVPTDWTLSAGISSIIEGTLGSLPKAKIFRDNANHLEFYNRIAQDVALYGNTDYAFSILGTNGNISEASLLMHDGSGSSLTINLDLHSGISSIIDAQGFTQVTVSSIPFSGGHFFTTYFKTPNTIGVTNIGLTPGQNAFGASIYATAAQLEGLSAFCEP